MFSTRWLWLHIAVCGALLFLGGGLWVWLAMHDVPQDNRTAVALGRWMGIGLAVVAVAVLGVLFVLLRRTGHALDELHAGLNELAQEDFGHEIDTRNRNPCHPLMDRFNRLSRHLAERWQTMQAELDNLQKKERFQQMVLGTMVEAVVAVDGRQRILFANRAAHVLLGLQDSGVEERPLWEAVRSPALRETVQQVLQEGTERRVELQLPRTKTTALLAASRLPGDPPPGAVLVLHDVTELRRLENLRRDFVSNVSHELKTPLTSIQAYAETLLEGAVDDPSHNREFVQRIADAADRLHTLILDLLALARIESEEQAFEVAPVSVRDVIAECLREHAPIAESHGLQLQVHSDETDIAVLADREALRTILDNLIENAIKYTPGEGRVEVHYERHDDEEAVRISVSDTGIGIPREHRDRIFERFYRVDRARSREMGGTGLGLAIVKHLVNLFDGTVAVSSEPGKGSTFTVQLPAASPGTAS